MAALYACDVVVLREPFVQEREIGSQQLRDRSVLTDHRVEEQLGFLLHGLPKRIVERQRERISRADRRNVPNEQPLACEVFRQGDRARIGDHASNLPLEHHRILQHSLLRHFQ